MMQDRQWILFEIAVNSFQGYIVTYFIDHVLEKKHPWIWPSVLCCIGFALCCTSYLFFNRPTSDTWMFLVPLIYALIFFNNLRLFGV